MKSVKHLDFTNAYDRDILHEMLANASQARMINMDLPARALIAHKQAYTHISCPSCAEILAFPKHAIVKNVILVCDWCEWEWKI